MFKKMSLMLAVALFLFVGMANAEVTSMLNDVRGPSGELVLGNGNGERFWIDDKFPGKVFYEVQFATWDLSTQGGLIKLCGLDGIVQVSSGGEVFVAEVYYREDGKNVVKSITFEAPPGGKGPFRIMFDNPSKDGNTVAVGIDVRMGKNRDKGFLLIPWDGDITRFAKFNEGEKDPNKMYDHSTVCLIQGNELKSAAPTMLNIEDKNHKKIFKTARRAHNIGGDTLEKDVAALGGVKQ